MDNIYRAMSHKRKAQGSYHKFKVRNKRRKIEHNSDENADKIMCQEWDLNPRPFGPVPETGALDQLGHLDVMLQLPRQINYSVLPREELRITTTNWLTRQQLFVSCKYPRWC